MFMFTSPYSTQVFLTLLCLSEFSMRMLRLLEDAALNSAAVEVLRGVKHVVIQV